MSLSLLLADRLAAARSDFAALPGAEALVALCDLASTLAGDRPVGDAADPLFGAAVMTAAGRAGVPDAAATTAAVLAHVGVAGVEAAPSLTLRVAFEQHKQTEEWTKLRPRSKASYAVYLDHLMTLHGDRAPRALTVEDVREAIRLWQEAHEGLSVVNRRCGGKGAEAQYVKAVRHLFLIGLAPQGKADASRWASLKQPASRVSRRRALTRTECRLGRDLMACRRDKWKSLCILLLAERAGLRCSEVGNVLLSGLDLKAGTITFVGKGGDEYVLPLTPGLLAFLRRYVRDRCPAGMTLAEFLRLDSPLVRDRPSASFPLGRPTPNAARGVFPWLRKRAKMLEDPRVSLHSYRYSLAVWTMAHYGRAETQAVLRHKSQDVTDWYAKANLPKVLRVLADYEQWLEAPPVAGEDDTDLPKDNDLPQWMLDMLDVDAEEEDRRAAA